MSAKDPFRKSRPTPTIVGTGLTALDVVIDDASPEHQRLFAGGTCGNVLTIMAWLGWDAFPVARLQDDRAGQTVLRDMRRWGVSTRLTSLSPQADTPVVVEKIKRPESGEPVHRFAWTCPGCGKWLPGYKPVVGACVDTVTDSVPIADIYFFDRVSRAAVNLANS